MMALPRFERVAKKPTFHITDRDVKILRSLNAYRYLKTSQVHELIFSENGTPQSARRRLKLLYQHRYIGRVQPYVKLGEPTPEIAYFLDTKGQKLLSEAGEKVYVWRKAKEIKHQFLQHALDLSDFRIKLEKCIEELPNYQLVAFIPDFEMRETASKLVNKYRYKLYRELQHPINKKSYIVHPDALIILQALRDGKVIGQRLIFIEIDRGTEGLQKIQDKLTGYKLYKDQEIFKEFGPFENFLLLFQLHSEKRASSVFDALLEHEGMRFTRLASVHEVTSESILCKEIWRDWKGERKPIIAV